MRTISLSLAALLLVATTAFAAGFTDSDVAYLRDHWGLKRTDPAVANMAPDQMAKLHALINDPTYRDRPQAVENHVGDYLFQIEICFDRPSAVPCPNAPRPNEPGKQIAWRSCISCHLVGSAEAPSFFKMAQSGHWTSERLATALRTGHQMSPITLSDTELQELASYIASQK